MPWNERLLKDKSKSETLVYCLLYLTTKEYHVDTFCFPCTVYIFQIGSTFIVYHYTKFILFSCLFFSPNRLSNVHFRKHLTCLILH